MVLEARAVLTTRSVADLAQYAFSADDFFVNNIPAVLVGVFTKILNFSSVYRVVLEVRAVLTTR